MLNEWRELNVPGEVGAESSAYCLCGWGEYICDWVFSCWALKSVRASGRGATTSPSIGCLNSWCRPRCLGPSRKNKDTEHDLWSPSLKVCTLLLLCACQWPSGYSQLWSYVILRAKQATGLLKCALQCNLVRLVALQPQIRRRRKRTHF